MWFSEYLETAGISRHPAASFSQQRAESLRFRALTLMAADVVRLQASCSEQR